MPYGTPPYSTFTNPLSYCAEDEKEINTEMRDIVIPCSSIQVWEKVIRQARKIGYTGLPSRSSFLMYVLPIYLRLNSNGHSGFGTKSTYEPNIKYHAGEWGNHKIVKAEDFLNPIGKVKEKKVKIKKIMSKEKRKIDIVLEKDNNTITLYIKIPEELENFFINLSKKQVRQSGCWLGEDKKGAKFYHISPDYQKIEQKIGSYIFNDYGDGLMRSEKINLAPLRTVGASKGVKIISNNFGSISNMDFEYYIRELGNCVKKMWEAFISKEKLKAVITFEI